MHMDKLLKTFAGISNNLQAPSLQNQISEDTDFGKKIEELNMLVAEIKSQQAQNALSDENLTNALQQLNSKLEDITAHCEKNLMKLDFLKNIKPLN